MLLRIFFISFLAILLTQISAFGFQKDYSYAIKGRVVDEYSKPVAGASITIKSPEYDDGCIIENFRTDDKGNFVISRKLSEPISEWTLFVTDESYLPANTEELLDVHMGTVLSTEYFSSFAGQKITVVENRTTDLGDVRLQIRHYPILLQILDYDGQPLIKNNSNFSPWFIIRDPRGDIISEGGTAPAFMRKAESAVMVALPEGQWDLNVSDDNGSGFEVSQIIDVKFSKDISKFTFKLKKAEDLKFEGRRKTFPYTPKAARREIERMGFDFSQDSFEKRVLLGNDKAVALFLNAGMNPNVLTKDEWFRRRSVQRPQVLKLLLEAGADINRTNDGWTALMIATGSNINVVKMLLDAGADVEAKNNEGYDALYYARNEKPEITHLLKTYLAKKKSK